MRISIDGNIGSGKSVLIKRLCELSELGETEERREPMERWQSMLEKMYEDPKRWAFTFNTMVLVSQSMYKDTEENGKKIYIHERSPLTCRHIFSSVQHDLGYMTGLELCLLDELYQKVAWIPDVIVYLSASPLTCSGRVKERARFSEDAVSIDYLEKVHAAHEWVCGVHSRVCSSPIIIIDASKPIDEVVAECAKELAFYIRSSK
jgi:deoxyadenosine/deoxycytidine kinase